MTIADALDRFLVQLHADGRSAHTVGQYRRHVAALTRWLAASGHPAEVAALDHETVAGFLASPAARSRSDGAGKKATSVNALRTSLRVFCSYLHRAGFVAQDPGRLVKRALCAAGPAKALLPEEQARFLPGREQAPDTPRPPASRLARQLALAYFIEREIEAERLQTYAEVARLLGISRARVSQIAGMVLLPVAVQEASLSDEARLNERALRKKAW